MPEPAAEHGTAQAYNADGCRCAVCKAGNAQRMNDYRQEKKDRRVLIDGRLVAPVAPELHGRRSTYTNQWCRCEACVAANTATNGTTQTVNGIESGSTTWLRVSLYALKELLDGSDPAEVLTRERGADVVAAIRAWGGAE